MSTATPKEIARQFIQAWNADQRHLADEWAAPNLTASYPHFDTPINGRDAFKEMLAQTHRFFPDLTMDVHEIVAEDDNVVVHWTYRGTFREGEMFGVRASGQSVTVTGMTLYQIEDGCVVMERGVVDNAGLMQQLGATPTAPSDE